MQTAARKEKKFEFTVRQARWLSHDVCAGVAYLHSNNIYHRDVKPANCLVRSTDCCVKLCDFGSSRYVGDVNGGSQRIMTPQVCTSGYCAPEILLKLDYNQSIDVWSVGCVVAELLALATPGKSPIPLFESCPSHKGELLLILKIIGTPSDEEIKQIPSMESQNLLKSILKSSPCTRKSFTTIIAGVDELGVSLLEEMIQFFPQHRISMATALQHGFFHSMPCSLDDAGGDFSPGILAEAQEGRISTNVERERIINTVKDSWDNYSL